MEFEFDDDDDDDDDVSTDTSTVNITYPKMFRSGDDNVVLYQIYHINKLAPNKHLYYYRRPECKVVINTLRRPDVSLHALNGSPGSGKSLTVWLWALREAQYNPERPVVWYDAMTGIFSVLHNNELTTTTKHTISLNSILIGDQFEDSQAYNKFLKASLKVRNRGGKVVLVSSLRMPIKLETIESLRGLTTTMPPWTLDDYLRACSVEIFFKSVAANLGANRNLWAQSADSDEDSDEEGPENDEDNDEEGPENANAPLSWRDAVRNKFYFAGHSVRFMFGNTTEEVVRKINEYMTHISQIDKLMGGLVGAGSADSEHHLFVSFPWRANDTSSFQVSMPLSRYVTKIANARCNQSLFRIVSQYVQSKRVFNASLDGDILELDVLNCLDTNTLKDRTRLAEVVNNNIVSRAANTLACVTDVVDIPTIAPTADYKPFTWFSPTTSYQGGFDTVQYYISNNLHTLRFVQVTRAARHKLKMRYMRAFVRLFNAGRTVRTNPPVIRNFEVMIMTIDSVASSYFAMKRSDVIGTLPGWNVNKLQVGIFKRIHEV